MIKLFAGNEEDKQKEEQNGDNEEEEEDDEVNYLLFPIKCSVYRKICNCVFWCTCCRKNK